MLALLARLLAPGTGRATVRPAAHRGRRRLPGVRHRLRRDPAARHVPQRDHRRPRLGPVLLRVGRRGAAPDHDTADRSGAKAAGRGLAGQARPADARLADRPDRAAHRRARRRGLGGRGDRGVLRDPLPARADPAVGRGGVPPPRARPGAGAAAGQPVPGDHRGRVAGRRGRAGARSTPCSAASRRATRCSESGSTARCSPCNNGTDPARGRQLGQLAETWLSLAVGTAPILTPMQQAARAGQDGPSRAPTPCCSAR